MALLWVEGFDQYGNMGRTSRRWITANAPSTVVGRFGGNAAQFGTYDYVQSPHLTTHNTMIVGFAVKFTQSYEGGGFQILSLYEGTTEGMSVYTAGNGEWRVQRGGSTLNATSGLGILSDKWYWVEFKVVTGELGSYELRVNGQTVLSGTNVDTRPGGSGAYHDSIRIRSYANSSKHMDDIYVLDGSPGLSDFLGNCRISVLYPDSDGGTNEWTPQTAGDHYAMVDEEDEDDDATYVESNVPGETELWGYGDLTATGDVRGVQVCSDACETDAGNTGVKTVAKLGSTTSEGPTQYSSGPDYAHLRRIMETDPDGAMWTPTNLNNTLFGVEVA